MSARRFLVWKLNNAVIVEAFDEILNSPDSAALDSKSKPEDGTADLLDAHICVFITSQQRCAIVVTKRMCR
jgi:hypothetical protein